MVLVSYKPCVCGVEGGRGWGWTGYMLHRFNLPYIVHTSLFGISEVTHTSFVYSRIKASVIESTQLTSRAGQMPP